jgi:hypothetical protein
MDEAPPMGAEGESDASGPRSPRSLAFAVAAVVLALAFWAVIQDPFRVFFSNWAMQADADLGGRT